MNSILWINFQNVVDNVDKRVYIPSIKVTDCAQLQTNVTIGPQNIKKQITQYLY